MRQILGCDFSSRPTRVKPIVLAVASRQGLRVKIDGLHTFERIEDWAHWLAQPGDWVGGFDLPFGLPRPLLQSLAAPLQWADSMDWYAGLTRDQIRARFKAYCDARPPGQKMAHRVTDGPAGSSPSMKWVNPPVAYMLHAGVPVLRAAGVHLPGLQAGDERRVALEAYPGLLAREILGRQSYKSDDKARQTPERLLARRTLLGALERGENRWGLRLAASHALLNRLAEDASGDALDACLCALQAAWADAQHAAGHPQWGLPAFDPLEGWILMAEPVV